MWFLCSVVRKLYKIRVDNYSRKMNSIIIIKKSCHLKKKKRVGRCLWCENDCLSNVVFVFRRTTVEERQVGEVCPAGAELDGGVSGESAHAVPTGVLQAGCHSESRHSHRDTVTLQSPAEGSVHRRTILQYVWTGLHFITHPGFLHRQPVAFRINVKILLIFQSPKRRQITLKKCLVISKVKI